MEGSRAAVGRRSLRAGGGLRSTNTHCDGDTSRMHSASITKDCDWSTFTCTLGWAIQAIWPEYVDGFEIRALLVVGNMECLLHLLPVEPLIDLLRGSKETWLAVLQG